MSAYLIEVADTKEGVCYPTIVGPFPDSSQAAAFAKEMEMGRGAQSDGGYSDVHVISDESCSYTPDRYRESFAWRIDEED